MPEVRHAFADESCRRGMYLMCAASVSVSDLEPTRRSLRRLRLRGQQRIHFASESNSRRKSILTALADLNVSTLVYVTTGGKQTSARRAILQKMVPDLRSKGVALFVLDSRQGQDHKDRATIHSLLGSNPEPAFEYYHHRSAHEPILWIPDAVAWAWGRGGNWRKQVEQLGLISSLTRVELP